MFDLYYRDTFLGPFPGEQEHDFQLYCRQHNITYQKSSPGSYRLFPPLNGSVVAVGTLKNREASPEKVVKRLIEVLNSHGALTIQTTMGPSYNRLLKIMNIHILLSFANHTTKNNQSLIRFFYSLRKKKESLGLIGSIIKQLALPHKFVPYEIPGFFQLLTRLSYIKYYLAVVPTIVIEISNLEAWQEEHLETAVLQGLMEALGDGGSGNQEEQVAELLQHLEKAAAADSERANHITAVSEAITPEITAETASPLKTAVPDSSLFAVDEAAPGITALNSVPSAGLNATVRATDSKSQRDAAPGGGRSQESRAVQTRQHPDGEGRVPGSAACKKKNRIYNSLNPPADGTPVYQFSPPVQEGTEFPFEPPHDAITSRVMTNDFREAYPAWLLPPGFGPLHTFASYEEGGVREEPDKSPDALAELRNLADVIKKNSTDRGLLD